MTNYCNKWFRCIISLNKSLSLVWCPEKDILFLASIENIYFYSLQTLTRDKPTPCAIA